VTQSRQQSLRVRGEHGTNEARKIILEKSIIRKKLASAGGLSVPHSGAKGLLASVRIFDELIARQSITDKPFAPKNTLQQLSSSIILDNMSLESCAKGSPHYVSRRFLAYKKYLGFRAELADLSSDFDNCVRAKFAIKASYNWPLLVLAVPHTLANPVWSRQF
jgi:hypothetical protein